MQQSISDLRRLAKTLGGLVIYGCIPGSPAHRAGLRRGDILLRINGRRACDLDTFFTDGKQFPAETQLTILRNGTELKVRVEQAEPAETAKALAQDALGRDARRMVNLRALARVEAQASWTAN